MITLEKIDEKNFKKILGMKLSPEQNKFVAPNVVSLAQAWLYYEEARPLAICCDGEPVGFIMLDWDEGERTVGIWRLMIAPEHQHKGYGRQALLLAIELARKCDNIDLVHLDYVPGNEVAHSLYYSLGFRENGDVEDGEIIMTLPITDNPRIGSLVADEDDVEDFEKLISAEKQAGTTIPPEFEIDLNAAAEAGKITRITLLGKTVGLAIGGKLLLDGAHSDYLDEAKRKLRL